MSLPAILLTPLAGDFAEDTPAQHSDADGPTQAEVLAVIDWALAEAQREFNGWLSYYGGVACNGPLAQAAARRIVTLTALRNDIRSAAAQPPQPGSGEAPLSSSRVDGGALIQPAGPHVGTLPAGASDLSRGA